MMSTPYGMNTECYYRQKGHEEQYNKTGDHFPLNIIHEKIDTILPLSSSLSFPIQESIITKEGVVVDESDFFHDDDHHHQFHTSCKIVTDSTSSTVYEINTASSSETKPLQKSQKKVTFLLSSSSPVRSENSSYFKNPRKMHSPPRTYTKARSRSLFFDHDGVVSTAGSRIRNSNSCTSSTLESSKESIDEQIQVLASTTNSLLYHFVLDDNNMDSWIVQDDAEQKMSLTSSSSSCTSTSIIFNNCSFHDNLYFDKLHSNRDKCPRKPIRR